MRLFTELVGTQKKRGLMTGAAEHETLNKGNYDTLEVG
jgi:hypothetical protein